MEDVSNVVSIAEWRRVQRRLSRMDMPELAMTTYRLIDVMADLVSHLIELQEQVDSLKPEVKSE